MTNYTKSTNFASKDSLASGNALKIVKGTEIDTEFNNIATAVATKADILSPTLTGTPLAPTASAGTNTTQVATTAFVAAAIAVEDAVVALKAPIASPTFTGTPAAPTASVNTNTTQVATTAFVLAQAASATPLANGTAAVGTATKFAREDHVHSGGLGVGQTWTDVKTTPGRVLGTVYTNSTGKTIVVAVSLTYVNSWTYTAIIDGVAIQTSSFGGSGSSLNPTISFIVPSGSTYTVAVSGLTLSSWLELR